MFLIQKIILTFFYIALCINKLNRYITCFIYGICIYSYYKCVRINFNSIYTCIKSTLRPIEVTCQIIANICIYSIFKLKKARANTIQNNSPREYTFSKRGICEYEFKKKTRVVWVHIFKHVHIAHIHVAHAHSYFRSQK